MKPEEKLTLLKRNTQEIVTEEELLALLRRKKKPAVYLGTAITGRPHIGNYFGAVKPQIELQDTHETYYFVADLHALTTVQNREELEKNITNVVLDYLALGLDPEKCVFFRQSDIPAHSQLAVVLANYVTYGHMHRMHEKVSRSIYKTITS